MTLSNDLRRVMLPLIFEKTLLMHYVKIRNFGLLPQRPVFLVFRD
ncbi:hypothetical protein ACU42Y_11005 [Proteus mirabilis]